MDPDGKLSLYNYEKTPVALIYPNGSLGDPHSFCSPSLAKREKGTGYIQDQRRNDGG